MVSDLAFRIGCHNRNTLAEERALAMNSPIDCPFCEQASSGSALAESRYAVALQDAYPVSEGHVLIIPRAHGSNLLSLDTVVQGDIFELALRMARQLLEKPDITGCNVGLNIGSSAGQTVDHAHVHVIPRRDGDVEDPRGGIRWVIPSKAPYWE